MLILLLDNFYEQTEPGVVCVFSLKNPSYPEFLCHAPCGVMCLDFHPEVTHLEFTRSKSFVYFVLPSFFFETFLRPAVIVDSRLVDI